MADFDSYSDCRPLVAAAAGSNLDGATPTNGVDTDGAQSLLFIAHAAAAVARNAVTVTMEESDDNAVWTAVVADEVLFRASTSTDTAEAFHAGYVGKKRYARASFNTGGTGSVIAVLGHLFSGPHDQQDIAV